MYYDTYLSKLYWDGHSDYPDLYEKTWSLAYEHIRKPTMDNRFVSSFIDNAFNQCTFLWDFVFITQFAKYARSMFDFMGMIDNFYSKQHPDGFICREIGMEYGEDRFPPFDPNSTGPNLFAYCEWQNYLFSGDTVRLRRVFPAMAAYYRWFRLYRSWPDGSYWNSGWGCGLDNSPRFDKKSILKGFDDAMGFDFFHGFHTWLDACIHQAYSGNLLTKIAVILDCEDSIRDITEESEMLAVYINAKLWDETSGFYYDCDREGNKTTTKTIIAFWSLLTEIPSQNQTECLRTMSSRMGKMQIQRHMQTN